MVTRKKEKKNSAPRARGPRVRYVRHTGRAPEGKARNRSSDGRIFSNSVSGQIAHHLVEQEAGDEQVSPRAEMSLTFGEERVAPGEIVTGDAEKHIGKLCRDGIGPCLNWSVQLGRSYLVNFVLARGV